MITFGLSFNKQSYDKPNIILIVADDLGWTDMSYMGSKYYETPNIDKLSQSGITFFLMVMLLQLIVLQVEQL